MKQSARTKSRATARKTTHVRHRTDGRRRIATPRNKLPVVRRRLYAGTAPVQIHSGNGLSEDQGRAIVAISDWMSAIQQHTGAPQIFKLVGAAGVGKTSLISAIRAHAGIYLKGKVILCAPTGKAASVLRGKGNTGAQTIHTALWKWRLIDDARPTTYYNKYGEECEREDTEDWDEWDDDWEDAPLPLNDVGLIIVDESSMVGKKIAADMMSRGIHILAVGDPYQLPPVGEDHSELLAGSTGYPLTEVHCQAKDSPILKVATHIREGGTLLTAPKDHTGAVRIIKGGRKHDGTFWGVNWKEIAAADQVLCGTKLMRVAVNNRIRAERGLKEGSIAIGERLVVLNNASKLLNGEQYIVQTIGEYDEYNRTVRLGLQSVLGGPTITRTVATYGFGSVEGADKNDQRLAMDYAYALTVHKSQGSEWSKVFLFDESYAFYPRTDSDPKDTPVRWLYTGITRAKESLTIVHYTPRGARH